MGLGQFANCDVQKQNSTVPRTIDCWTRASLVASHCTKGRLFVGVAAVCLSEGGVQHVFSTSEEALVALELVAKTL